MKHEPVILTERQKLVREWAVKKPAREDYPDWHSWSEARSFWVIDMYHALERFDRRQRWAKQGIFCDAVK